ncbi:MAG: succinylglutamate desuccinylase/aspartoacylase family protein [Planctomycetes bacterium]|jgi:hypothetical protein|nr:succinylglutamate desuccinylase/aspartoacylase family protein [Planctomycetota bacterium]MCL4731336.1 succinylglutamate desuccinylase/aspartoacylase family protein [Planctomycetota bacterium]
MRTALLLMLCVLAACSRPQSVADNQPANVAPEPKPQPVPEPPPKPRYRTDIVITTGVHGNEPSGYLVQDRLIELGFVVFGPCNPWGIANNQRHLQDGRDLNRCFAYDDCPEAEAVREFLRHNKPGLLLDLHEDPDGTGPYLIQNGPEDELGRLIIDALRDDYAWDPEPQWGPVKGADGLIKPTRGMLGFQKLSKVYSLAYYAWLTYGCTAITVEVPGSWPEDQRKAYQLKVCETARRIFSERNPP